MPRLNAERPPELEAGRLLARAMSREAPLRGTGVDEASLAELARACRRR